MKTNYQNKTFYLLSAAMLASSPVAPVFAASTCVPIAQISPVDQNVPELTSVTLNGQPSKDTTAYLWTQTAGTIVTLNAYNVAKPTFSAPDVGPVGETLTFKLTVTGCSPAISNSITTNINVTDVNNNRPPMAAAIVSPVDIYEGIIVTLDGSSSSDPDGNVLTYKWEQIGTPSVTLTNPNAAAATFTAPSAPYPDGISLKFKLTVSDGSLTGTTEFIVNVLWLNQPPVADVSCPLSVDEGANGTLNGSGSADPDDGIASYLWSQTLGGPIVTLPDDLATESISFTAPFLTSPLNEMSFKLEVTDKGGLADSATCDVLVNDITPPTAEPTPTPPANGAGWNNTDVDVNWNWTDAGVGIDDANCTKTSTSTGEGNSLTLSATCKDLAGNEGTDSYDVKVDKTQPTISAAATTAANGAGWYNSNVTVQFTCADALSGIAGTCPVAQILSSEGSAIASTAQTVADNAGNTSNPSNVVTVSIDKTAPTVSVTGVANGATYTLGSVPVAGCSTSDALSGVATNAILSGGGSGVGTHTVTCNGAVDNAGNTGNNAGATYTVIFNWTGFFQPVDNLPTPNRAKAGSAVPVKFSLGGNQGLNILAAPINPGIVSCTATNYADIEQTVTAGQSSLTYDATADQYIYVWKTDKAWAGSCRKLTMKLNDGTVHEALFSLTK